MSAAAGTPTRVQRVYGILLLLAALLVVFLLLGYLGAAQAARGQRVLAAIEPLIQWIRTTGKTSCEWLLAHTELVGEVVSATGAGIALVGLATRGWSAWPLALLALAVASATWGEIMLLADRLQLGIALYACGLACAFALGIWCPIRQLPGFLDLPFPPREPVPPSAPGTRELTDAWRLPWEWECGLVFVLVLIGLVARLYALPELPNHFDLEMIESMVASHTSTGFSWWTRDALVANSGGLLHLLPRQILFRLFGASVYTLRLASVVYGVAAIPLMYLLVRRLAGWGPAVASTLLLLSAPEQLFWSRTENTHFSVVACVALITVNLSVWMIQRFSFVSLLVVALWMPVCRFCYASGIIMFLHPIALLGHAVLFVRGMWRKLWYAVPLLGAGAVLWFFSLSLLLWHLNGYWRYTDAVSMHGGALWRKQGQYLEAGPAELVLLQARSIASNLGLVIENMTDQISGFSHWNERMDLAPHHMTIVSVGVVVVTALGVAYFLAQLPDRRGFALLVWVGIGLLPGLMSNEPADRRIAAVYPAMYALAGVFIGAIVRVVRRRGGRIAAGLAAAAASVAVAGFALAHLVSHFLLPASHTALEGPIRFTAPMFADGDVIVHNLDQAVAMGVLLGNLDGFLQPEVTPCIQTVTSKTWVDVALDPHCDFTDRAYRATMLPERAAQLKAQHHPRHVTFLMQDMPYNRSRMDLLQALYPAGRVRLYREGPSGQLSMFALTVSVDDVAALHAPTLHVGAPTADVATLQRSVLAGVTLASAPADAEGEEIRVQGGFLIERSGWYLVGLGPACAAAHLNIDGRPAASEIEPMSAGVHAFEIVLPSTTACELPLQLLLRAHDERAMKPLRREFIVGPGVAAEAHAQAPPVASYEGYGAARPFVVVHGTVLDFGVDAAGTVSVLVRDHDVVSVHRFDPEGREEAVWQPQVPPDKVVSTIAVDAGGTVFIGGDVLRLVYDRDGRLIEQWKEPYAWPSDIAFWRDGLILTTLGDRGSVALLDRHGKRVAELKDPPGGRLLQPIAVTTDANGNFLVVQQDGLALLFHNDGAAWDPTFVRSFQVAYNLLPPQLRRGEFDGADRILLPDVVGTCMQVYDTAGEHLMAADPRRDPSALQFGQAIRIAAVPAGLYLLDGGNTVWRIAR